MQEISSSPIDIEIHSQVQSKTASSPFRNRCISVGKDGNLLIQASSTSSSDGLPSGPAGKFYHFIKRIECSVSSNLYT